MTIPVVHKEGKAIGNNLAPTLNFSYKKAPINEAFDI